MRDYAERYGGWGLILGGSEGLGRAIAEQAARRKLNLALVARRPALLEETAKAIAAHLRRSDPRHRRRHGRCGPRG